MKTEMQEKDGKEKRGRKWIRFKERRKRLQNAKKTIKVKSSC